MQEDIVSKQQKSLSSSFATININNPIEVLEWFYDNINIKTYSEEDSLNIYMYLKDNGYKPITSSSEELENYNIIMKNKSSINRIRVASTIISIIMNSLNKNNQLEITHTILIEMFNERFNKERTYKQMMSKLNDSIGKNVVFTYIHNNKNCLQNGIIDEVVDYKTISINGIKYPFVGYNVAIKTIDDVNGKNLYNNYLLGKNYNLTDFDEIESLNTEIFGNNYQEALKKVY